MEIASWQHIGKRYGDTVALDDFCFSLHTGQITALLGPNGAGKTTAVGTLIGHVRADSGVALVAGAAPGSTTARSAIGVMLQQAQLAPTLSGREQLRLHSAFFADPEPLDKLIADLSLASFVDRRYAQLSGGQQRRIQFALALVGKPSLLLLDEPTGALDALARREFWDSVEHRVHAGLSVLLTTHELSEAERVAHHIAVIRSGRIVASRAVADWRESSETALIRCRSALGAEVLSALPRAQGYSVAGDIHQLGSDDVSATLRALLQADRGVDIIDVARPTLEARITNYFRESP